jgi:hypothetical protein
MEEDPFYPEVVQQQQTILVDGASETNHTTV